MAVAQLPVTSDPGTESQLKCAERIENALGEREQALQQALGHLRADPMPVVHAARMVIQAMQDGGKVLTAGNGGSAAEAQHFAAELVGRFKRERVGLPALALTADSAVLTAIANDYGFDQVFARQIEAWGQPGDALVLFSTSGQSPNLLRAVAAARTRQLAVIAITGDTPSHLAASADVSLKVAARDTAVIQEVHVVLLHLLCDLVEEACGKVQP